MYIFLYNHTKFFRYSKIIGRRYSKTVADTKFILLFLVKTWLKYRQSDKLSENFMSFILCFLRNYGTMKSSKTVRSHDTVLLRFPWNGETWASCWEGENTCMYLYRILHGWNKWSMVLFWTGRIGPRVRMQQPRTQTWTRPHTIASGVTTCMRGLFSCVVHYAWLPRGP